MFKSASKTDCDSFLEDAVLDNVSHICAVESPDFPVSVRRGVITSGLSGERVADISYQFVTTQKKALGKIKPVLPEGVNAKLVYLPIPEVSAFAVSQANGNIVVITSGIYDLLRNHSVNSIFANRLELVENKTGESLPEAHEIVKILNLCSVLFFSKRLPGLLLTEDYVSQDILQAGWRLAEVSLLFIILHEFGHAHYASFSIEEKKRFSINILLHVAEELTETKIEEFYSDLFALNCLSPELLGPVIHASLVFFVIRSFIEATGASKGESHPLAVNRIWNLLMTCQSQADSYEYWSSGIIKQFRIIEDFYRELNELYDYRDSSALDELSAFVEMKVRENKNAWLSTIRKVCDLNARLK